MTKKYRFSRVNLFGGIMLGAFVIAGLVFPIKNVLAASQDFYVQSGSSSEEGMLMSLTGQAGVVTPATTANSKLLVGVVAPPDDTQLGAKPGQINVRTDGTAEVLTSTLDGNISIGDRISPSSILGIGEKLSGSGWFVGTAQSGLAPKSAGAIQTTITDTKGARRAIYVATIPVLVKVSYFTASGSGPGTGTTNAVPGSIQSAANTLAGKHAALAAVILSFFLALIAILLAGMVVNSAIRGGLLAIARQPLAKRVIGKNVIRAFGMAVLILLTGLVGAFLVLRIF